MRSEGFKDVMLVIFTITVIAVFLYALVVEPILEHRQASRWARENENEDAAAPAPDAPSPPEPPEAPGGP